jgi:hypothetical protein
MTTPTDAEVKELSERLRGAWMQGNPAYGWPTIAARYVLEWYELRLPHYHPRKCLFNACDKEAVVQRCHEHLMLHYELRSTEPGTVEARAPHAVEPRLRKMRQDFIASSYQGNLTDTLLGNIGALLLDVLEELRKR